ncbi:hypothetical protein ACF0H5_013211 [Mactra antiquata]
MLRLFVCCAVIVAVIASTTMPPSLSANILYDTKHHKAMIVRADGCYEYHLDHQDMLDMADDAARPVLEARMLAELATAINIQAVGHNHINHMTSEITTACENLPVYQWDIPAAP